MKKARLIFTLITIAAFALAIFAAYVLKTDGNSMERPLMLGWGAVMVASVLTMLRGLKYLRK